MLFELRDKRRPVAVFVRGTENIPTPEEASNLLRERGAALSRSSSLEDRVLYEQTAPFVGA